MLKKFNCKTYPLNTKLASRNAWSLVFLSFVFLSSALVTNNTHAQLSSETATKQLTNSVTSTAESQTNNSTNLATTSNSVQADSAQTSLPQTPSESIEQNQPYTPELEPVSLQLKWKHQFQFAGYYAAKIKGFYAEHGLDVTIKERNININNIEQVVNGDSEYGIADSMILLYQAKKAPVTIVSTIFQHSPQVFISLKSSNITSPYDMQGKDIAFYSKDTDGFALLAMLHENKINANLQRLYMNSIPEMLTSRQVAAYPAYLSNEPYYFYQRGIDINIIDPQNFGVDFYGDLIFTNNSELENNPHRVEAFKQASIKGWQYALANPEEIIDYIINDLKVDKTRAHLTYEARVIADAIGALTVPIGTTNPGRFEFIQRLFEKQNIIDKDLDLKDGIYQPEVHHFKMSKKEKDWAHFNPDVKVAINLYEKPIAFLNDSHEYDGITKQVFDYLGAISGLDFEFITDLSETEALESFNKGKVHILPAVVEPHYSLKNYELTPSYLEFPVVITTLKGENFIGDIKDVGHKHIGIKNDPTIIKLFNKHFPDIPVITFEDSKQGLEEVKKQKIYAYIDHLSSIGQQMQKVDMGQIQISGELPFKLKIRMAISKDLPELHAIISKAIEAMDKATQDRLTKSWLMINYQKDTNFTLFLIYSTPVILIFIFVLIYSRRMRKLNKSLIKTNAELIETQKTLKANQSRLEVLSMTDFLTGAYNRQHVEHVLKNEISRCERYDSSFSVLLIDLDNFKNINDTFGHLVGDEAIKATFNNINEQIRKSDIIGRWGGEEFVAICPETNLEQALMLANKIIDNPVTIEAAQNKKQTVSIGVAQYQIHDTSASLVERADQKLYQAKKKGKNRACS